jgi:hypothetical protein
MFVDIINLAFIILFSIAIGLELAKAEDKRDSLWIVAYACFILGSCVSLLAL